MKKLLIAIGCILAGMALGSCRKANLSKGNSDNSTSQNGNVPVTIASLAGKWMLVNDTTTTHGGINENTSIAGVNYIGKASDYYDFAANGKLNFHDNMVTGAENYKLSHDTVFVEYAYIDGQTNQLDSAYSPIYVVTRLSAHNCTMTERVIALELNAFSTINLSR
jgi:hypothetical protein